MTTQTDLLHLGPSIFLDVLIVVIVAASIVLIFRQKGSYFRPIRLLLIAAYALIGGAVLLGSDLTQYVRDLFTTGSFPFATTLASIAVSSAVMGSLAFAAATEIAARRPSILFSYLGLNVERGLNLSLTVYTAIAFNTLLDLWLFHPFALILVQRPFGPGVTIAFDNWFSASLLLLLAAFVVYPCRRMIVHARGMQSPLARKGMVVMGVSWGVTIFVLVYLNAYVRPYAVEARAVGAFIAVALNLPVVYYFKRTTLLESILQQPLRGLPSARPSRRFSERLGMTHEQLLGKKILLEFSPSSNYTEAVKDFVDEMTGTLPTLVVTTSTSPLRDALANEGKARLFSLSPTASDPQQGSAPYELLIPDSELSLVFEALANSVASNANSQMTLVFDILSQPGVTEGFERTRSHLRRSLESQSPPSVTEVHLFDPRGHHPEVVAAIRAAFAVRMEVRREVLRVVGS